MRMAAEFHDCSTHARSPIAPKRGVDRARKRLDASHQRTLGEQLEKLRNANYHTQSERLDIRNGDRYQFVAMEAIDWVESANN